MRIGTLGVIADDFTGATDVAAALRGAGLETLLFLGVPGRTASLPPHQAIVVALKSRSVPPDEAVRASLEALEWLQRQGVMRFYFKYCSTFDSTPAGNIGPVLDALGDHLEVDTVVTTPSSPEHGRTVYQGHLFVGDRLLSESHMRRHPLNPMRDSSLPRLLEAQTGYRTALLARQDLRAAGVGACCEAAREQGVRYLIADAVDDEDLRLLGAGSIDARLTAGAAGFAGALASAIAGSPATDGGCFEEEQLPAGRTVVLSGSCSRQTLRQLAAYRESGQPVYAVEANEGADPQSLAEAAIDWFARQPECSAPLISTSVPPDRLSEIQAALGSERAAHLMEAVLARVAVGLRDRGVSKYIIAGGETSGAVVSALGLTAVRIGAEAARGVPWISTIAGEPLALLLKSGNFGEDGFLLDSVAVAAGERSGDALD